ncbi:MAG: ABC transporter ATP-binding protein [Cellulosilyticaceae bacterium]
MIQIQELQCTIGDQRILEQINLEFESNKIYGIIGPNGAGKSTLLKHMMRIIEPQPKTVFYQGQDITKIKVKGYAKMASFVFQENSRDVEFTVKETLLMGRYPYMDYLGTISKADTEIVDAIIEELKLEHLKYRYISTLSGGEAQKVFIGRALVQGTPLLLLDEPTSMLDVHNSVEILELVKQIKSRRDLTIIMVLHDLNLAFNYCDHIVLMEKGKVVLSNHKDVVLEDTKLKDVYHNKIQIIHHENGCFIVPKTS